jgi:alkylhydroperoxidase family enzyme
VPYTDRDRFPEKLVYVWDAVARDSPTPGIPPNIFRVMGQNPDVLRGYLRLGNTLWNCAALDKRTLELTILRCAFLRKHEYEWHQHVRIGRAAGVTDAEINALGDWRRGSFSPAEQAIFAYADALDAGGVPPQETLDRLAQHFDESAVVGITLLCLFYFFTGSFLTAMEVPLEEPFIGWSV